MPDPEEDPHGPSAQKSAFKPVDSDQFQIGTRTGAHLLLQTRTRVLNEDLDDLFRRWYPKFRSEPQTQGPERKAA
jgi:hypothetical protein